MDSGKQAAAAQSATDGTGAGVQRTVEPGVMLLKKAHVDAIDGIVRDRIRKGARGDANAIRLTIQDEAMTSGLLTLMRAEGI